MRVGVFGTGYVGLVTGICAADIGHEVICVDVQTAKIQNLQKGIVPFYEPNLDELLKRHQESGSIRFSTNPQDGCQDCQVIIIAVGTPSRQGDDAADISCVVQAVDSICPFLKTSTQERLKKPPTTIIIKSTVPLNTGDLIEKHLHDVGVTHTKVVSNPEFLREGAAIEDFYKPDRIVVGSSCLDEIKPIIQQLYSYFLDKNVPFIWTTRQNAELIKYASNVFLATKVAFINEIAHICDHHNGADVEVIAQGMGLDHRINHFFLKAGPGFGGSCFPKDTRALCYMGQELSMHQGFSFPLMQGCLQSNKDHMEALGKKIINLYQTSKGQSHKKGKISIGGIAFKAGTDDVRESPAAGILSYLAENLDADTQIAIYDPKAMENGRFLLDGPFSWSTNLEESIHDTDLFVILTEWPDFKQLNWEYFRKTTRRPVIFDSRNLLDIQSLSPLFKTLGIHYYGLGKDPVLP
jgi:UDPglucose 6-dehydrogenase